MLLSRRAFTLVEVLVGASLSLLVTVLAYQLLSAFVKVGSRVTAEAQLQQMAAVAMGRIAVDTRRTAVAGVTLSNGAMALIGLADIDPSGRQVWDQKVVLYYGRGGRLIRREVAQPQLSAQLPSRLAMPVLDGLIGQGGGICLSDCLASLQVSLYGPDGAAQPLTVTLRLARQPASGKHCNLELSRNFYLRNAP